MFVNQCILRVTSSGPEACKSNTLSVQPRLPHRELCPINAAGFLFILLVDRLSLLITPMGFILKL